MISVAVVALAATACIPRYPTPAPGSRWNTHTIARGAHNASVSRGADAPAPLLGITRRAGRTYHFVFDSSARYRLTAPTQPEDQFDWNKLPGLSDCGQYDLSRHGLMFAWRWRLDLVPKVLEITAYWNDRGVHHTLDEPLLTLTRAQVDARIPLWFRLRISNDRQRYEFALRARIAGREVSRTAVADRPCPRAGRELAKWAGGFYFGGTSVAPQRVRGYSFERR